MVKKFMYKGVPEESISQMSLEEYSMKSSSRIRRTLKRLKFNPRLKAFYDRVRNIKKSNPKKVIKTHMRDAPILPEWIGMTFAVHNGKEFKRIDITMDKVGKRLGEYSHTCGRVLHSGPGVGATRGSKFVPLK